MQATRAITFTDELHDDGTDGLDEEKIQYHSSLMLRLPFLHANTSEINIYLTTEGVSWFTWLCTVFRFVGHLIIDSTFINTSSEIWYVPYVSG